MDRFVCRGYMPFPTEPFAQSDVAQARIVCQSPEGTVVLDETKTLPVNAAGDDWDLSNADVVMLPVDPAQPDGEKRPWLKTTNTFEADQGAEVVIDTSFLDDATPPNTSHGPQVRGAVKDTVPPSIPGAGLFIEETEINVPTP